MVEAPNDADAACYERLPADVELLDITTIADNVQHVLLTSASEPEFSAHGTLGDLVARFGPAFTERARRSGFESARLRPEGLEVKYPQASMPLVVPVVL